MYDIITGDWFLPVEQAVRAPADVLGYLADRPVVVELEPAEFVDLIIHFYDRALQEVCEC